MACSPTRRATLRAPQATSRATRSTAARSTDGTSIFWAQGLVNKPTSILSGSIGGGGVDAATVIATSLPFVSTITNDATRLYWGSNVSDDIRVVPKAAADAAPSVLAAAEVTPHGLHVDGDGGALLWVAEGAGNVRRVPLPAGVVASIASNQPGLQDLAVDAAYVYWIANTGSNGLVMRVKLDGSGTTETLATSTNPGLQAIAVSDKAVFAANSVTGNILRIAKP